MAQIFLKSEVKTEQSTITLWLTGSSILVSSWDIQNINTTIKSKPSNSGNRHSNADVLQLKAETSAGHVLQHVIKGRPRLKTQSRKVNAHLTLFWPNKPKQRHKRTWISWNRATNTTTDWTSLTSGSEISQLDARVESGTFWFFVYGEFHSSSTVFCLNLTSNVHFKPEFKLNWNLLNRAETSSVCLRCVYLCVFQVCVFVCVSGVCIFLCVWMCTLGFPDKMRAAVCSARSERGAPRVQLCAHDRLTHTHTHICFFS